MPMKMLGMGVLAVTAGTAMAIAAAASTASDDAQAHGGDHRAARAARLEGRNLPLREIERRVVPQVRNARYLGFNFDPGTTVYTLKFLRDGTVIWVNVDGRSGQILDRSDR
jgi:uncharacterized membrane protein YkoI